MCVGEIKLMTWPDCMWWNASPLSFLLVFSFDSFTFLLHIALCCPFFVSIVFFVWPKYAFSHSPHGTLYTAFLVYFFSICFPFFFIKFPSVVVFLTMRVHSISLLKSFYSKKLGGGWGKGWTCSSFPVTMFKDNSPPQKFISLFVTFGVWVALVLVFQLFLCPFMQQQLQTSLCNAILLFHCLVLISRRVLVYFTLTLQHFSWNILDFLFRTANLISFLVIVPQGVLNGALTEFLSAIIEIGSQELWFWFVYRAVFQSIGIEI